MIKLIGLKKTQYGITIPLEVWLDNTSRIDVNSRGIKKCQIKAQKRKKTCSKKQRNSLYQISATIPFLTIYAATSAAASSGFFASSSLAGSLGVTCTSIKFETLFK